jgi:hypothetical protein
MYIKAEEYIEVEADNVDQAHEYSQEIAASLAKSINWETEMIRELN